MTKPKLKPVYRLVSYDNPKEDFCIYGRLVLVGTESLKDALLALKAPLFPRVYMEPEYDHKLLRERVRAGAILWAPRGDVSDIVEYATLWEMGMGRPLYDVTDETIDRLIATLHSKEGDPTPIEVLRGILNGRSDGGAAEGSLSSLRRQLERRAAEKASAENATVGIDWAPGGGDVFTTPENPREYTIKTKMPDTSFRPLEDKDLSDLFYSGEAAPKGLAARLREAQEVDAALDDLEAVVARMQSEVEAAERRLSKNVVATVAVLCGLGWLLGILTFVTLDWLLR